jgi:hypothetical protein
MDAGSSMTLTINGLTADQWAFARAVAGLVSQNLEDREACTAREARLQTRINKLEEFICNSGGLVNEWAKTCPFGTKMADHIKGKLYEWLKHN